MRAEMRLGSASRSGEIAEHGDTINNDACDLSDADDSARPGGGADQALWHEPWRGGCDFRASRWRGLRLPGAKWRGQDDDHPHGDGLASSNDRPRTHRRAGLLDAGARGQAAGGLSPWRV